MAGVTVRNAIERRANLLLIVLFAVAVALPGLAMLAAGGRADVPFLHFTEQRLPAPFPPWERGAMTSGAYGRDFESAFGDALPGRSHLVEGYDAIRYYGFGDTTTPVIVRGRDGWMFASEDRDYRRWAALADDGDIGYVAQIFAQRARWCRAHGAAYVVFFAPDKSTIYPEQLPADFPQPGRSAMTRVLAALRAAGVTTVDVRPAISAAKTQGLVYSKGDTHWTDIGAYAAYRAVAEALRESGFTDRVPAGAMRMQAAYRRGDFYAQEGVDWFEQDRQLDAVFAARAHDVRPQPDPYAGDPDLAQFSVERSVNASAAGSGAILFGDSFSWRLHKFFAEDVGTLTTLRYPTRFDDGLQFNEHAIAAEHPRFVIQEVIERHLAHPMQE
jgi:alginate O-acetyltransferase complex protein AlgJ